jgi:hypothetical protein
VTTIAYKNGILAADKRARWGSLVHPVTKIRRLADGSVAGGSGELAFVLGVFEWLNDGGDPATFPQHQQDKEDWQPVLVVRPNGKIEVYERTPYPVVSEGAFFAIGSGRDFAMMAMRLGKSAPEAVQLASEFDAGTGPQVDTLTVPGVGYRQATPTLKPEWGSLMQRQQLQRPGDGMRPYPSVFLSEPGGRVSKL